MRRFPTDFARDASPSSIGADVPAADGEMIEPIIGFIER